MVRESESDEAGAASQHVLSLSAGYMVSAALHSVATLDVASQLRSGPRSAAQLASAVGADADALHRVLRLLSTHGVFRRTPPATYSLNAAARCLLPGEPGSTHAAVRWLADSFHLAVFAEMTHSVRTGEPAVASVTGDDGIFAHLAANAALARTFNAAMSEFSAAAADGVLAAYDFGGINVLVDVGGGHGAVLAAVLRAYPGMQGVVYDLPQVASGAGAALARAGVADRSSVVAGNFFATDVPMPKADAYILKHIIHDWDDYKAGAILSSVRAAMQPPLASKRVLLVERVMPSHEGGADDVAEADEATRFAHVMDMEMLVVAGGREMLVVAGGRTCAEFTALLRGAGLRLARVVPTRTHLCVIEARPDNDTA